VFYFILFLFILFILFILLILFYFDFIVCHWLNKY